MRGVCACSNARYGFPRSAEYRDTPQFRAASATNVSIKTFRQASRRYGSSPNSSKAGISFPFFSRANNSCEETRAIR